MQVPEAKEKLLSPKLPTDREITILAHFKQGRQQTDKSHAIFKRRETPDKKPYSLKIGVGQILKI